MMHDLRKSVLMLLAVGMTALQFGQKAMAQPCYSGFRHRVPIEVDNRSNAKLTNYELKLNLNTSALVSAGKMRSLGQDIRFLDGNGNELNYWIEDGTMNSSSTTIWVKVDSLPDYARDTIYLFYGNATSVTKSNANATFRFVDEFNGSTLSSGWGSCGTGTVWLSGGKLKLTSNSSTARVTTNAAIDGPLVVELQGVSSSGGSSMLGQTNTSGNGYGVVLNGSTMQMNELTGSSCLSTNAVGGSQTTSGTGNWTFIWNGTEQKASLSGKDLTASQSGYSISGKNYITLANFGASGTMEIDYLRVRLYTPNEPGITWGQEQNMNFSISATYSSPLCAGGTLELKVDTIAGAVYSWTGPNGFKSSLQNPKITGVSTTDAGRYDITVEIPSGCASKSSSVNVNISPKAEGGSVSGTQTVCEGANSGQLSLSGHTGNVIRWDSSCSSGSSWTAISNTGLNQSYTNLSKTTYFRAIVANGSCSIDSSSVAVITVTPKSKGGAVSGGDTVCAGTNSGVLTLAGYTGTVVRWESSANGNLWSPIVNKGVNQSFNNLSQTSYYRAVVQNGNCDLAYSAPASVYVNQATLGGTVSGTTTICPGSNSGWLVLTGNRGDVLRWESADPGSSTWTSISNRNDSLMFQNLTKSTTFRALVKNGACSNKVSTSATVTVYSASGSGVISGAKAVCEGSNSGTLSLTGSTGNVLKWQEKTASGSWSDIASTKTTYNWSDLSDTTWYRALVSNAGCSADTSSPAMVPVHKQTNGGYIQGTDRVCSGANTVNLNLKAFVGDVTEWQESSNGYAPWSTIKSTTDQLSVNNLTADNYYRSVVKNGVCKSTYSSVWKVAVDQPSVAGKIVKNLELCEGTNFGVIRITGETGDVVKWQKATSPNGTWTDENITNTGYEVQNIDESIYLRAIVQNGVCTSDTSETGIVEVDNYSNAGDIYGDNQFCDQINNGQVEIKGKTGSVLYWEMSENDGANWNKVVSDQAAYTYKNLSVSTIFRAVVQNGVCPPATSQLVKVLIADPSDAGTLKTGTDVVCTGNNYGIIKLKDQQGDVQSWQIKTAGSAWGDAGTSGPEFVYRDLAESMSFRVIVQNKFCEPDTSDQLEVIVSELPVAGQISGDVASCEGVGKATLMAGQYTGKMVWQESENLAGPWVDNGEDQDEMIINAPVKTMYYRTKVSTEACPSVYSEPFEHKVYSKTVSGKVSGVSEVCFGVNEGVLELVGATGDVVDWEKENPDGSWSSIGYDGTLYWFENLTESSGYRVVVKNGECDATTSEEAKVIVNDLPKVDFTKGIVCEGELATFVNTTTVGQGSIDKIRWMFSDGYTTEDQTVNKVFPSYGKYQVTLNAVTDKGCSATLNREVVVGGMPTAFFTIGNGVTQNSGCLGAEMKLNNLTVFSDKTGLDYAWDFGNGTTSDLSDPTVNYNTPGTYKISLKVTTRSQCVDEKQIDFTVLEENKPIVGDDVHASLGIGTQLSAKGAISYRWEPAEFLSDPDVPNPIATVTENTKFTVTGTDYYGCESSDDIWVLVDRDYSIVANNVITPDGNNENDVWLIRNIENYSNNKVSVYDRWGREVYVAESYDNTWGATDKEGRLLMDGTYYYVIEFPEIGKVMKGAITVVQNK